MRRLFARLAIQFYGALLPGLGALAAGLEASAGLWAALGFIITHEALDAAPEPSPKD